MTPSREVNRFQSTALARATNTQRHSGKPSRQHPATRELLKHTGDMSGSRGWAGGVGRAERDLQNSNFGLPPRGVRPVPKRVTPPARGEYHGPSYEMVTSEQRQSGDPAAKLLPMHGVPPGFEHPADLMGLIIAGAPRAMPVSQMVEHGVEPSRSDEFEAGMQDAAVQGLTDSLVGFKDRRYYGRRFRATNNEDEPLGPQEPYPKGHQQDVPFSRYQTF